MDQVKSRKVQEKTNSELSASAVRPVHYSFFCHVFSVFILSSVFLFSKLRPEEFEFQVVFCFLRSAFYQHLVYKLELIPVLTLEKVWLYKSDVGLFSALSRSQRLGSSSFLQRCSSTSTHPSRSSSCSWSSSEASERCEQQTWASTRHGVWESHGEPERHVSWLHKVKTPERLCLCAALPSDWSDVCFQIRPDEIHSGVSFVQRRKSEQLGSAGCGGRSHSADPGPSGRSRALQDH